MDRLRAALWAFAAAFAVHVADEAAGGFSEWAQDRASPRYTQRDFVRNNALGLAVTLAATALATRPRRRGFRLHYALVLTQQAAGNAVFHGATRAPGRLTAIGIVLPLWAGITQLACQRALLRRRDVATALAVGGAAHGVAVAHQVYFLGPPGRRGLVSPETATEDRRAVARAARARGRTRRP
ncbi:MAG: hypothetical protein ICV69_14765 [Thermoleophilaceae bacterium]|nr:hypothetical protein [Thermoleophilaceae bacterium]